jgi:crossover junction endodeoxyribonuclease RuvC
LIILGIDPGTAVTGYGVVSRAADGALSLLECGVIRTSSPAPHTPPQQENKQVEFDLI